MGDFSVVMAGLFTIAAASWTYTLGQYKRQLKYIDYLHGKLHAYEGKIHAYELELEILRVAMLKEVENET